LRRRIYRLKFSDIKNREIIRTRDNHTCQHCGKKWIEGQRRLHIHHIDCDNKKTKQWDNLDIEANNMITLCHQCHFSLHKRIRQEKSQ
jgi:5-methylcytosine-specific restriction endonuclease McrA